MNHYPDRPINSYATGRFVVATLREELTRLGMLGRVANANARLDEEICVPVNGAQVVADDDGRLFHHAGMAHCLFSWSCCGRSGAKREPFPVRANLAVVLENNGRDVVLSLVIAG